MSRFACAFPDSADPIALPFARARVRIGEHRWSTEFAAQLSAWAASAPILVVLAGGRALLSDHRTASIFPDQVAGTWFAPDGERAADAGHAPARSCTVLRFEPGADVALLREHADPRATARHLHPRAPLVVQLQPAPYFRFLYRRRSLALGSPTHAELAERDALGLLRHVLLNAWPCGQSRILSTSPRQARHRSLAFEAQSAMSQALACRHPLEELARSLNTSPFHLAHVFRSEIGISLHQYLVQLRLIAALERLAQGEPDLSKLALDLGFSHHSHFSSQFRRAIGYSPREIRRLLTTESAITLGAVGLADGSSTSRSAHADR